MRIDLTRVRRVRHDHRPVYLFAVALALVALSFAWGVRVADSAWMANAGRLSLGYRCRGVDYVVIPAVEFWRKWHRIPDHKIDTRIPPRGGSGTAPPQFKVARDDL